MAAPVSYLEKVFRQDRYTKILFVLGLQHLLGTDLSDMEVRELVARTFGPAYAIRKQ